MATLAVELHPLACNVNCTEDILSVELLDGRTITVPISWFPTLLEASQSQRDNWEILGDGEGIYWPDIDEDLSVSGLLKGVH
ncbi:DUF2442 domain-containing protein [Alkalimarinus alittae]|uniref:DUF2442 domain-containing protein n=1 Tax=Alkalimarinus alittae TaxID=2961619 RepID=A0ABY6N667_9ALTE|nr:DUF2442 domain-containing protein [Alkalimarinus alittae]UZE97574.1 DUF2442 domain-containing protein [Alkalimarinus alittae]